jgi:hypothetical protein
MNNEFGVELLELQVVLFNPLPSILNSEFSILNS